MEYDPLLTLVIILYGSAVSWIQERFGSFQDLPARTKQLINAFLGFLVPAIVTGLLAFVNEWPVGLGTPEEFVTFVLLLLAPFAVWLVTQVAHQFDLVLKRATGK